MLNQLFAERAFSIKRIFHIAVFAVLVVTLLAGCAAPASTPTAEAQPTQVEADQPTAEPAATSAPTATSTIAAVQPAGDVSFAKDVNPILQASCATCHGIDRISRGLNVTTYETLMAGATAGVVIVPGDPAASKLLTLIKNGKMPKRGDKLTEAEIQLIADWIQQGAPNN